jgi:uncharacterized membrane protein
MTRLRCILLAVAVLVATGLPAHATLTLCNRTSYVLEAATSAFGDGVAEVKGWTRIAPGDCVAARPESLRGRAWFVHARSSIAHGGPARAWGGKHFFCVRNGNFALKWPAGKSTCPVDGDFPLGFASIDTKGRFNWTTTLDESPPLPTLQAAQLAGVKRLLRDNGYKVGPLDGKPDKATGAALADFRKKFAPEADNAKLIAVLEKRARLHAGPAGLTVCNDGKLPLRVALGKAGHSKKVARGWWTVTPDACAQLQTVPLGTDVVYLLARTRKGETVLSGPHGFCITDTAFEIQYEQARCSDRGYRQAGFAKFEAHGSSGVVLHLGGSAMQRPVQAEMLK